MAETKNQVKVRTGVVKLSEVKHDPSIYPREKWSTSTIEDYADALRGGAVFPPIVLEDKTNRLIDGVHRWKAYQLYLQQYTEYKAQPTADLDGWAEPKTEIDVQWHIVPKDVPIKLYAASLSVKHGDRITTAERKKLARDLFTENPDFRLETLTDYIGGSKSTLASYVADIRARRKEEQKITAYRLYRLGWTQGEIETAIDSKNYDRDFLPHFPKLENEVKKLLNDGLPHNEVAKRYNMPLISVWDIALSGKTDAKRFDALGINCQPYDVWHFSKSGDLFGAEYPGRIPGELVAHVLYFFTEPGAMIIDPMAGSGTTLDVCLALGRKCYAYDIHNKYGRPDIIDHDLTSGWPDRVKKADLIFWDPPYFSKMDDQNIGSEGYGEGSISKMSRDDYLAFLESSLVGAKASVKKGTKIAFLMSDWDDDKGEQAGIFVWDYADILRRTGWTLKRHIQVPLSTQQVHPDIVNKFRASRRLARLERYLLIGEA